MAIEDLDIPTNNTEFDFRDEDVSVFKTEKFQKSNKNLNGC